MGKNTILIILVTILIMSFIWKISEQQKHLLSTVESLNKRVEEVDRAIEDKLSARQLSGYLIKVHEKLNVLVERADVVKK